MLHLDNGTIRISPGIEKPGLAEQLATADRRRKDRAPRPPNAFILYRKANQYRLKDAHPELHNNEICKSSCALH